MEPWLGGSCLQICVGGIFSRIFLGGLLRVSIYMFSFIMFYLFFLSGVSRFWLGMVVFCLWMVFF